jgi:hypothetical protein
MSLFTACSDDDEAPDYSKVINSDDLRNILLFILNDFLYLDLDSEDKYLI